MKMKDTKLSYTNLSRWFCGVASHPPQIPLTNEELLELKFESKIKLRGSSIMRYLKEGWFVRHADIKDGYIYRDRKTGVIKMMTHDVYDYYNHDEMDMEKLVDKMWGNCGWSVIKPTDATFQLLLDRR